MPKYSPRIPKNCPPAFLGRYTVQPGDTFYTITQIFRVRLEALAVNNPHIADPNLIYPGDVLCVPGQISYPCSIILNPQVRVPFGTGGVVYINFAPRGGQAVSFMATLPDPSEFGDFNSYTGEITIPQVGGFGYQLFPTPEDPPTWSSRIELPIPAAIVPNSRFIIYPSNSYTGFSGPSILENIIDNRSCLG